MRRTAKSHLLNEVEIKWYLLPSFNEESWSWCNCYGFHGNINVYWLQQLRKFSNVADDISAKLLSSFFECEVLAAVPDRYGFEFLIKAAERKRRTEDSAQIQEIQIFGNRKVPTSFQSYLGNSNNETNLVKYVFQK